MPDHNLEDKKDKSKTDKKGCDRTQDQKSSTTMPGGI